MRTVSKTYGVSDSGSNARSRCKSEALRNGCSATGPVPGATSIPNPTACAGTTMSLYKTAASTPYRCTGCSVMSAARRGCLIASRMLPEPRIARYSGRLLPAWRMNHTGVWRNLVPLAAARNGSLAMVSACRSEAFIARNAIVRPLCSLPRAEQCAFVRVDATWLLSQLAWIVDELSRVTQHVEVRVRALCQNPS